MADIKHKIKKLFGRARGSGRCDYLYALLFNANPQKFVDSLPKADLDVLIQTVAKSMPNECAECCFFQAYSEPESCTLGNTKPMWGRIPEDCLLMERKNGDGRCNYRRYRKGRKADEEKREGPE